MKPTSRKLLSQKLKKIKKDGVTSQSTQNNTNQMVERIYAHVSNELQKNSIKMQKDLSHDIYNCIAKQLHNELVQFRDYTEKYLNQRITNEFNLIKRDLSLILDDQQPKDMNLDKEDTPSYYS